MEKKRPCAGLVLVFLLLLVFPGVALSAVEMRVSGETRTVLESYDAPSGNSAMPFYQYFRLRIDDGKTVDGWKMRIYGRLGTDLSDEVDVDSRLYYAYFEKRGVLPKTDLRVGRQWVNTVAGSPIIDGIRLTTRHFGSITAEVFGGGYVTMTDDRSDDYALGFSVSDRHWKGTDLGLSYLQKWVDGDLAREFLGMSADVKIAPRSSAYIEGQYDLLSQVFGYYLAGVRYVPRERWKLKAEYYGSTPVFDATDIYSVFAVDDFREMSLSADYQLDREWTLFGGYTQEFYRDMSDAHVYEAGCDFRKSGGISGYLSGVFRSGDEELKGIKGSIRTKIPYGISLNLGAEYNVYTRIETNNNDDTSAKRYWVQAGRKISDDLKLDVKLERIESIVYDYFNRGRVSLRYRF